MHTYIHINIHKFTYTGGLNAALSLDWSEGGSSKHVFLIADAPCHGTKYHDKKYAMGDNYANGDPHGLVPEELVQELMNEKEAAFTFIKIDDITDKMIQVVNEYCRAKGGKQVQTISLKTSGNMAAEFAKLVTQAVISELRSHHS